jgi:hypothetical protein
VSNIEVSERLSQAKGPLVGSMREIRDATLKIEKDMKEIRQLLL